MNTSETPMSSEESLRIINSMISSARRELYDGSSWYLIWGWLVFIAAALNYILINLNVPQASASWLLMLVGAVISMVKGSRENKTKKVRTHADVALKHVLVAFMICLAITLFMQGFLQMNTYPMVMMVYGMWLYVSGSIIQFNPLRIGGILNWVLAVAAFFLPFHEQLLVLAAAVAGGYIIPGYMLRSYYRKLAPSDIPVAA